MAAAHDTILLPPDHALRRVQRAALVAGVVGLVASAAGAAVSPARVLGSYLVAYLFLVEIALGSLAILMINYLTGGAWGAIIRRLLESGVRTLPLLALLFLPVALGTGQLYEWARPDAVAHDPLLAHKQLYLNVPFFLARAAFYFAAWIMLSRTLLRWSLAQDASDDPRPGERLELVSRGGLVLLGLTMTFAAIDWMMSLEPHWFSTIYGILFMGGSVVSAFAFVIPMAAFLAEAPALARVFTPSRLQDLGKLLLAFVMLWAYFHLSQFLIIWAGNLPEEIPWYVSRTRHGWQWLAGFLVAVHLALPFAVLLSRRAKRNARVLAALALVVVVARFTDLVWMVAPALGRTRPTVAWPDVATFVGLGGLWLALFVRLLDGRPLVPLHDPSLEP